MTTTVTQAFNFVNNQRFNITNTVYMQDINQNSAVNNTTTVATSGKPTVTYLHNLQFPLTLDISQVTQSTATSTRRPRRGKPTMCKTPPSKRRADLPRLADQRRPARTRSLSTLASTSWATQTNRNPSSTTTLIPPA